MGRYFVVLTNSGSLGPYVIAEVVRELGDDGRSRDVSLAANLAGPFASIMTERELCADAEGRAAMHRWRNGRDFDFHLDSIGLQLDLRPDAGADDRPDRVDPVAIRKRMSAVTEEAHEIRRASRLRQKQILRSRRRLQALVEQLQATRIRCEETLRGLKQARKPGAKPARHLRSVS
jgi:hypothetical protein